MPVVSSLTRFWASERKALIFSSSTAHPLFTGISTISKRPSSVAIRPIWERTLVLPNKARILRKLMVKAMCTYLMLIEGLLWHLPNSPLFAFVNDLDLISHLAGSFTFALAFDAILNCLVSRSDRGRDSYRQIE